MKELPTYHAHPHKGTRFTAERPGFAIIESGLASFDNEKSEDLAFPFEALDVPFAEPDLHTVVIDLPYKDMVKGNGKGYVLELIDYATEGMGNITTKMLQIDLPFWGSPIQDQRIFLLLSSKSYEKMSPLRGTGLGEVLPEVAFHAPSAQRRNLLYPGFHSMFGYVNSATETLPPPSEWKGKYPMCEKRTGDTLKVSRLSKHDIEALWGYVPLSDNPGELTRVTPLIVLQTFLNRLTEL